MKDKKLIIGVAATLLAVILFLWLNPFGYNKPTERTVVTTYGGKQFVVFKPGVFWAGFKAAEAVYPNQIGVQYKEETENLEIQDNTVDIGRTKIQFLGGATATVTGIVQFNLPDHEGLMIKIHNSHQSIEGLVKRRLSPYTQECLNASAQLMNPETHYNGGKAQMTNEYIDQLRNGSFLLEINKVTKYDSIEKQNKSEYIVSKQLDKNKQVKRKFSSIKEYEITVGDAQITNTEYEDRIKVMLGKQIDAATAASVAKQQYVTAQQEALTEEAKGKKILVQTEYAKKVEQTNQLVEAQTKVLKQEQYKLEQKAAAEAAVYAAQVVRTEADAEAYKARQLVSSGLTPWDKADFEMKTKIGVAEALAKTDWPDYYNIGGNSGQNDIINALLSAQLIKKQ